MWALTSKRQNRSFCVLLSLLFGLFFVLAWSPFFHVSSLLITSSLVRPRWCLHLSLLSLFSSAGVILSLSSLLPSSSNYLSKMDWRSARKEKKSFKSIPSYDVTTFISFTRPPRLGASSFRPWLLRFLGMVSASALCSSDTIVLSHYLNLSNPGFFSTIQCSLRPSIQVLYTSSSLSSFSTSTSVLVFPPGI